MAFNIFGKKTHNLNYLELTPYCIHGHEKSKDGTVNILIPRFKSEFANKYLLPKKKSKYVIVNLDEFASVTWLLINGSNKVTEIADKMVEKYGDKIQPVNDRITQFLTQLYHNGFISFNELKKGDKNG